MENKEIKTMFVVSSVDIRTHTDKDGHKYKNESRAWSFWETQEKAIEEGIFGWNGCEAFYESGYYTHIVVEEIEMNCPLFNYDIGINQVWFQIVPEEANKEDEDIRKSIVRCECPEEYKNVIGFI